MVSKRVLSDFSMAAAARGGYLQDRGLVPMPQPELAAQRAVATALTPMTRPAD